MKKFISLSFVEVFIVISVILAGFLIFAYERQHNNLDYQKSWVAFYFVTPQIPNEGVAVENHLGQSRDFQLCLIADSDKILEPVDISCKNNELNILESQKNTISTGQLQKWQFKPPQNLGKYWVVLEYTNMENQEQNKILSFTK